MGQNASVPVRSQAQDSQSGDTNSSASTTSANNQGSAPSALASESPASSSSSSSSSTASSSAAASSSAVRPPGTLRLRSLSGHAVDSVGPSQSSSAPLPVASVGGTSRRRRRTSSSDETGTSSSRSKRRQRTSSALRRITSLFNRSNSDDDDMDQAVTSRSPSNASLASSLRSQPSSIFPNARSSENDSNNMANVASDLSRELADALSREAFPRPGSSLFRRRSSLQEHRRNSLFSADDLLFPSMGSSSRSLFRNNNGHTGATDNTNSDSTSSSLGRGIRPRSNFTDHAIMLSRLLAIAASATASSLVGSNAGGLGSGRSMGASQDGDNSFHGFLNQLQNGLLANELAGIRSNNSNSDGASNDGENTGNGQEQRQTQNFFRMFRFSSPTSGAHQGMVPVLIVGIRAMPMSEDADATQTAPDAPGSATFFNASSSRPIRLNGNRTNSSATTDSESSGQEQGRENQDDNTSSSRQDSNGTDSTHGTDTESHQNRRPEDISLLERLGIPGFGHRSDDNDNNNRTQPPTGQTENASSTSSSSSSEQRQSWIVYVVGGTYPSDHPILLAPSLFTDDPSYEDMLVLETFLGQAKPPVATKDDVEASGGIITVGSDLEDTFSLGERCLVCLSAYEPGEECRKLNLCGHVFHKDCIDQWLTTGRNSCPLCRGEGVKAQSSSNPSAAEDASNDLDI
uniref:ARAD1C44638p n=1 Tax=Blastobotrys adeninivorans TaxID=409370 RepID=A0A060T408_BLAAD